MTTWQPALLIVLAVTAWLSIVAFAVAIVALFIAIRELRKLTTQIRRMIQKVSSSDLKLEVQELNDNTGGTVTIADGWEDGIETPRD